jgi:peptidoglycan pentaglycine glycine transferase (the first glycine)
MEFQEIQDKEKWNQFVGNNPCMDILQGWEWGELKRVEGWKPYRFAVFGFDEILLGGMVLVKKIPLLGNLAYIPHGPAFNCNFNNGSKFDLWKIFEEGLIAWAKGNNVVGIEIEPKLLTDKESDLLEVLTKSRWKISGRNRQSRHKLNMDIEQSDEELLAGMEKNTRYNIKYAEKNNVEFKSYPLNHPEIQRVMERFYRLLKEMQSRANNYPIRSYEYFQKLIDVYKDTDWMVFNEVSFEGDVIAMNISQFTKSWASSFYAGSNRLHPKLKATYLLRWKSILLAKKRGCKIYDFWGVILDSPQHEGYSKNKLSYGGKLSDAIGIWELPIKWYYFLWPLLIKIRSIIKL